jgi:hypothetical protein
MEGPSYLFPHRQFDAQLELSQQVACAALISGDPK